jgi:hypothetical protein
MLARVSSLELAQWIAFYRLEAEEAARQNSGSGRKVNTRGL